jgi:hypothetical protein
MIQAYRSLDEGLHSALAKQAHPSIQTPANGSNFQTSGSSSTITLRSCTGGTGGSTGRYENDTDCTDDSVSSYIFN